MKKLIILFSALALISSCAMMEETGPVQNDQSNDYIPLYADLPEVIYASASDESDEEETRTYVDGNIVKWHSGESISYYAGEYGNVKYTMKEGQYDGTVSAEFVQSGKAEYTFGDGAFDVIPEYPLAIYPYREGQKAAFGVQNDSRYNFLVNYAKEQTYAPNSFGKGADVMVATGSSNDDENLYFRHACGYLVIKLYGTDTKVSNITLTALGEGVKISGEALLVVEQNEPVQFNQFNNAAAYNTVSLDCSNGGQGVALGTDEDSATEFWFALPPVNIEGGIKIVVTDVNGATYTKQTTKDVNITRNDVQPMAALQFVAHTQALNKIWYTKTPEAMAEEGGTTPITFYNGVKNPFDATITDHRYDSPTGKFVIEFDRPVKTIQTNAFYGTDILTIELPDCLETIGENAFSNTQITSITIPGSVSTIGKSAFQNTGLTSVTIPGTVIYLGSNTFTQCSSLKEVTFLPSSENEPLVIGGTGDTWYGIEESPFYETLIQTLVLNRELVAANSEISMSLFRYQTALTNFTIGEQVKTLHSYMFSESGITALSIPGNVTKIEDHAFSNCVELKSVTASGKINFGEYAFTLCDNLETISLDGGVSHIGISAFSGCEKLRSIIMDEAQSSGEIANSAFNGCSSLTSIIIPGGITSIGDDVFYDCTSLSSVTFLAGSQPLTMGFRPGMVAAYRGDYGPFHSSPLTTINLDRDIVMSDEYDDACDEEDEGIFSYQFYTNESHRTTVTLGNNVTTLPRYMFANSGITGITIPGNLTTIGNLVFVNCTKLSSVTINDSSTPLHVGFQDLASDKGPFWDSPLTSITLNRELESDNDDLDATDEGIFSNKHKNPTTLRLGGSLRTILPYMFSETGVGAAVGSNGQFNGLAGSVWIPHTITNIGNYAFYDCDKLAGLTLGYDGTTALPTIGNDVFDNCDSFRYIKVRNNQLQEFQDSDLWNDYEDKLVTSDDF